MLEFDTERRRRIEQFRHYISLMPGRRAKLERGNCFITFEERSDRNDDEAKRLTESRALALQPASTPGRPDASAVIDDTIPNGLPIDGWRDDDSTSRFIQFSFNPRYFDMDIPNTTLWQAEAAIILRRRSGFFHLKDNRQFAHPSEEVDRYNPLRKIFLRSDAQSAAENMAYVFFDVWRFPVDWRFYVTAAAFHEPTNWERGVPIE